MRKIILISVAMFLYLAAYGAAHWRQLIMRAADLKKEYDLGQPTQQARNIGDTSQNAVKLDSLPALDAHGFYGEHANLNRGCPGFARLYQGLGLTRWPELGRGTVAYLSLADALNRRCRDRQKNFVFLKQGWWLAGSPPTPNPTTCQVPVSSVTRIKPGFYTFNYAVYFPSTETYAWINHGDYGFPINLIKPQKASLSLFAPPLNDARPAQIYCWTCR